MRTFDFQGKKLSKLGFGMMRLPVQEDGSIDKEQVAQMIDYALAHGVNYFDTALPYHGGTSELVAGELLKKYPRDSYYLADKYPGHQHVAVYDPAATFEEQLTKCGVDYFDFYLLHSVSENSIAAYEDSRWGIIDYFAEQKRQGRIRHLGFSFHGGPVLLEEFLQRHAKDMEFCQIQFNFLDWTLQNAKKKYEILEKYNLPVWVMEPLRGGKFGDKADTSFRWIESFDNVGVILSGMSNLEQMQANVETFSGGEPITEAQKEALLKEAESMKDSVPCTACGYCKEGCPMSINIPDMMSIYNESKFGLALTLGQRIENYPEEQRPASCIGCGACEQICPQGIAIPKILQEMAGMKFPEWRKICAEREAAAKAAAASLRK